MTRTSVPAINPPPLTPSPELRWLLLRAFGPIDTPWSHRALNDQTTADAAVRLDVAARIGSRMTRDDVLSEAGPETATVLTEARDEAALQVACLRRLLDEVGHVASGLGLRVLVLKGMAYQLNRSLDPGARPTGDLDLLAPAERAHELFDALVELGFRQATLHGTDYHLPVLVHPHGMVLEIHTGIGYLRASDGASLDLAAVLAAGRIQTKPGLPEGCLLPDEDLLMAHLLGHFLGQHRQWPMAYPLCRMLLDCADLAWPAERWRAFWQNGYPYIAQVVDRADIVAVGRLVDGLAGGADVAAILCADDRASRMLRHAVFGALDPLYRGRLVSDVMVATTGARGRLSGLMAYAAGRMWRPRAELEARFGSGGGAAAHAWRRFRGIFAPAWTVARVGIPWLGKVIRSRFRRLARVIRG